MMNKFKGNLRATQYHSYSDYQFQIGKEAFESFNLHGKVKILDVGCRAGKITHYYAQNLPEGSIVGIDSSKQMIDFAKKEYPNIKNLSFKVANIASLPFNQEFDNAYSFYYLHWLPRDERQKAFNGIYQSLKKGAKAFLYISCEGDIYKVWKKCIQEVLEEHPKWKPFIEPNRLETIESWLSYARNAGFHIDKHSTFEKTKVYPTKADFKKHLKILDIAKLDDLERDKFIDKAVDKLYASLGLKDDDEFEFSPSTLILYLSKL